jgi:hypothetical protein
MKLRPLAFLLLLLQAFLNAFAADAATSAAGHWEGTIALPNGEIPIRVDLSSTSGAWQGTIDMPSRGMRGFKMDPVKIDGAKIEFTLPGLPGDPRFTGQMGEDRNTISGEFTPGQGKFDFKLERKAAPAAPKEEAPVQAIPGQGIEGHWFGVLKPTAGFELRLALEITKADPPTGLVVSLDQGQAEIPLTALAERDGGYHLEFSRINGAFDGKFNAEGSELAGEWQQGGRTVPLVFKRVAGSAAGKP